MRRLFLLGAIVAAAMLTVVGAGVGLPPFAGEQETGFLDRVMEVDGAALRYQVYIPPDWTAAKKWPTILFLHGAGERGDDGLFQTAIGLGNAIRRNRDRFPVVAVFPQSRKEVWWHTDPTTEKMALAALDEAMAEFNGDPQRVYLTGLSMGGFGTWSYAARNPGRFAALVPICGGLFRREETPPADDPERPYRETAEKIGQTPVWIFHGGDDTTVPVAESRRMHAALMAAGGNVRYTEYEGVGHNSWTAAYAEAELMPWLLSHRLLKK